MGEGLSTVESVEFLMRVLVNLKLSHGAGAQGLLGFD